MNNVEFIAHTHVYNILFRLMQIIFCENQSSICTSKYSFEEGYSRKKAVARR